MKKRNILICGAGAIGSYVGGLLAHTGHHVVLLTRERQQKALQANHLTITDWKGRKVTINDSQFSVVTDTQLSSNPQFLEAHYPKGFDWVFITVKRADTYAMAELLSKVAPQGYFSESTVISLQNGVGTADEISSLLKIHHIHRGVVSFNVAKMKPGHYHQGSEGFIAIEKSEVVNNAMSDVFLQSGLKLQLSDNIERIQWGKLVLNLNNAVNALSGVPLIQELHTKAYREILAASIEEALLLLRAANIKPARMGKVIPWMLPFILRLPNLLFKRVASSMLAIDSNARSSMADDLSQGRKTEIDYINGEIVRVAERLGKEAPINKKIMEQVRLAEQAGRQFTGIPAGKLIETLLYG